MKKLSARKTARQELFRNALVIYHFNGTSARDAILSAIDGWEHKQPTTIAHEIGKWWDDATARQQSRLINELGKANP